MIIKRSTFLETKETVLNLIFETAQIHVKYFIDN